MENINIKIRIYSSIIVAFLISHFVMKIITISPEKILTQLRITLPIKTSQLPTPTSTITNSRRPGTVFSTLIPSVIQPTSLLSTFPLTSAIINPTATPIINIPTQPQPSATSKPSPTPTNKPTATPTPAGACPAMNNSLPNSTIYYPNGSTSIPTTTKQICAYSGSQYQSLPYRNPNCLATQNGIRKAYEKMKTYYPSYWQGSKLLTDWQTVQTYANKYNFNPLFVIALWIEESIAGGATAAQQLGCLYRLNKDSSFTFLSAKSTICEQMECLFGRRSVIPSNFALWACQYQYGANKWENNQCLEVTTATKDIEFWYNYIGENLASSCQIKYYSPADSHCSQ